MKKRITIKKIGILGFSGIMIPSIWTKPVIDSVLLPAHAMTSCNPQDIAGDWVLAIDSSPGAFIEIRLFPPRDFPSSGDGIRLDDGFPITWGLSLDRLVIDIEANMYDGTINRDCSIVTGIDTSNNVPFIATRS